MSKVKEKAKKPDGTKLTDKEKEQQRLIIPLDKIKELLTNLSVLFETDPVFQDWEINKNYTIKGSAITIKFNLLLTAIERELQKLDPGQGTLEKFLDPDKDGTPEDDEED